ncbi:anthranilate synthase component I family protein [bacterium]|nr:anthranilate synthase component I family protein [bacterium]
MQQRKLYSKTISFLSDLVTPVTTYLRLRESFSEILLLESADSHSEDDARSFICIEPLLSFEVAEGKLTVKSQSGSQSDKQTFELGLDLKLSQLLNELLQSFTAEPEQRNNPALGFFGFTSYDAVQCFESINFQASSDPQTTLPLMRYALYRYVISVDHRSNLLSITENSFDAALESKHTLDSIKSIVCRNDYQLYDFKLSSPERSVRSESEMYELFSRAHHHIQRGDVFQIVLSQRFQQKFQGDEFQVYRALRSINPSPYLFYFDYVDYRIFGSSPESQLRIRNGQASITPIAGTVRRAGIKQNDLALAEQLKADPKEQSEHVMLVDLARNDLNRFCTAVKVEAYQQIEFFSHVIHLVSHVSGAIDLGRNSFEVFGSTLPAGTLAGAPKYKAMQLIDQLEGVSRSFYGGAVGFFGLNGEVEHAITIRSFLSKDKSLFYQAGAGVVAESTPQAEYQEIQAKLGALRLALKQAQRGLCTV